MDKATRAGMWVWAGLVALCALSLCSSLVLTQTQLVPWLVDVTTPRHEVPYSPPTPLPPPVGVVERIELERIEGQALHMSATTTHKDGTWLTATAYREYKHADPERYKGPRLRWHDDLERPARYEAGEVCAPVRVWVADGALRWVCVVDDARWLTKQRARPPLISPQVVVELVGPGGSERLRVELPLTGQDKPTSGTE